MEVVMKGKNPYQELIDRTRTWIFDLPDSELLMPILELRFTHEEAGFLSGFPYMPHTLDQLAQRLKESQEKLLQIMEPIIRKGAICEIEGKSGARYSLSDPIFFLYRMPGWKGVDDAWNRQIVPMLNKYYVHHLGEDVRGRLTKGLRAIPVNATVADTRQILPYEDVLEYVEKESYHAVSACACRHRHNLDPDRSECRHETETCLHFGKLAQYTVKYGMGRQIVREETLEILKRSADAGLVHGISNTKTGVDTICNCCSCCCLMLEPLRLQLPRGHQRSNYVVSRDTGKCQVCGLCAKRCPVKAIELIDKSESSPPTQPTAGKPKNGKKIVYDGNSCIGCGVCAHKCPTQSLSLVRRSESEENISETMAELGRRMLMERGRDMSKIF
jgi:NAD-dependent dihydropyrimidine dehydrogenase PreA subunit